VSPDIACLNLSDAHIQGVISLAAPTETAESPGLSAAIRVNAVGMLGVLGQRAAPSTGHAKGKLVLSVYVSMYLRIYVSMYRCIYVYMCICERFW
jgi:hypothetical protein